MSEVFVRDDVRKFLDFLENLPGPKMHEMDAPSARAQYVAMKDIADPPVGTLATIRDLEIPGPAGAIPARLFDAREAREPGPMMLFFHGGGFVIGNLDTHASACAEIARMLDMPVLSIDYRLAPEHCWPAAPDDCEAAARWVASHPEALGLRPSSLVLCGDSAGGTLTIVTAMALRDKPAEIPVIAQFPIYPAADLANHYESHDLFSNGFLLTMDSMQWFADAYQADLSHMRASPMHGDLAGMPPAVVITAGLDPLRDQGRAYAAGLIKAGVPTLYREARGNIHGFINLRQAIPSSQGDLAGALRALKALVVEVEGERAIAQAAEPVPA